MPFSFRHAAREDVAVLVGVAGGTGSGKTYSAMRVAKGLAGGKRFVVIDTENRRALHYADLFDFDHADLRAPFRPERYAEAITDADKAGYPVIVVDSASHEHAGDGGLLDWHEEEYQRLGGRDNVKMTAWIKPKMAHKQFVSKLLQVRAHVILCFRAEEKIEIIDDPEKPGKKKIVAKRSLTGLDGWIPISEKNLPYELTASFLLTADQPGVPKPIKLQEQHKPFVPLGEKLSERTGEQLGAWAKGSGAEPASTGAADGGEEGLAPPESAPEITALHDQLVALVTQLGATDSLELIEQKTAAADKQWLKRQITTAKKTLAERQGETQFRIPEKAQR
jgi:AAA domain-containing protein